MIGTPPRTLLPAIQQASQVWSASPGTADPAVGITSEVIESVLSNGHYMIRGTEVSAAGPSQLRAGQTVTVAWKDGKPSLILAHQARRAQYAPAFLPTGGGVAEELLIAPNPGASDLGLDVFYRNDQILVPLGVGHALRARGILAAPDYVKWGTRGDAFFVRTEFQQYHVFALARLAVDKVQGIIQPTASYQRSVDLPSLGVRLTSVQLIDNRTVGNIAARLTETWQPSVDGPTATFVTDAVPLTGTAAGVSVTPVLLTLDLLKDGAVGGLFPGAFIQEMHLDDARHLIGVVALWTNEAASQVPYGNPARTIGTQTIPSDDIAQAVIHLPTSDIEVPTAADGRAAFDPTLCSKTVSTPIHEPLTPITGQQIFLVDFTLATVLWKSCLDPMVFSRTSTTADLTDVFMRLNFIGTGSPPEPNSFTFCLHGSPANVNATPINSTLALGTLSDTFLRSMALFDHAKVPLVAPEATWFAFADTSAGPFTRDIGYNAVVNPAIPDGSPGHFYTSVNSQTSVMTPPTGIVAGDASRAMTIRVTFSKFVHDQEQRLGYYLDASYAPRRASVVNGALVNPPGILYVFVRQIHMAGAPIEQVELGLFSVDVASGVSTVLQPFGVALGGDSRAAALTANRHRLLYRAVLNPGNQAPPTGPAQNQIVFVSRDTGAVDFVVLTPPTPLPTPYSNFLLRGLVLLAPDFLYWPEEVTAAHVFVLGWDHTTGALTLTATAATAPPADPAMRGLGVLRGLTNPDPAKTIVPLVARDNPNDARGVYGGIRFVDGLTTNLQTEVLPGPSWEAVNDVNVLTSRGRFQIA